MTVMSSPRTFLSIAIAMLLVFGFILVTWLVWYEKNKGDKE